MKKLPKNRLTDLGHLRRFSPPLLAEFFRRFKGLNLHLPDNPTDETMPYDAIRRACFRVDEATPPEFLVAIHLISATATPSQRRRVEALAERRNITLGVPEDVSDHDFAIRVWFAHPGLLEAALFYAVMKRQRKYSYYPPAGATAGAPRTPSDSALRDLENDLDIIFGNKGYGIGARIMVEDTPDELWILIRRGERIARVAAVAEDGDSEIHVLRPENYDVVIVNKHHALLKVLSKPDNQGLHGYYRALIGDVLYGSTTAFLERNCFNLEQFKTANPGVIAAAGCPDIRRTALVGVYYEFPGAKNSSCRLKDPDIFAMRGSGQLAIPAHTTPGDVTVKVYFVDDDAAVEVKVFNGNVTTFSREGAAYAVDDWMIQRGILSLQETAEDAKIA